MLAKNYFYDVDRILPSFQGRPFCMDIKIDGERMLCHREGDKVIRCVLLHIPGIPYNSQNNTPPDMNFRDDFLQTRGIHALKMVSLDRSRRHFQIDA